MEGTTGVCKKVHGRDEKSHGISELRCDKYIVIFNPKFIISSSYSNNNHQCVRVCVQALLNYPPPLLFSLIVQHLNQYMPGYGC
jgi:hypothetical protein